MMDQKSLLRSPPSPIIGGPYTPSEYTPCAIHMLQYTSHRLEGHFEGRNERKSISAPSFDDDGDGDHDDSICPQLDQPPSVFASAPRLVHFWTNFWLLELYVSQSYEPKNPHLKAYGVGRILRRLLARRVARDTRSTFSATTTVSDPSEPTFEPFGRARPPATLTASGSMTARAIHAHRALG